MAEEQTLTVSDEQLEALKTKFQAFLEGLDEQENALFAAMVASGDIEGDDVEGYWSNWSWGNWWSSNSFISTNTGNVISTGGGNFRGW